MVGRLVVGAAVFALAVVLVRADEEKVPLDKLPKEVKDVVKKKFPEAELVGAAQEKDEAGKTVYELTLKNKKLNIDVTVTPEGKIMLVEKEIEAKDLPKAVASALEAKFPKATIKRAEELSKDDKVTAYEFVIVTTDKKTLEVEFAPDGKFVKEEKKEEEKEKKDAENKKKDKQA
jgi:hypothetical protein